MTGRTALFVAALAVLSGPTAAGEWTQFRGPGGAGVAEDRGLPVRWQVGDGAKENLRWKAELPGRGVSCPVIAGGRVFVTACTGYKERRLHLLCFEEATGKKLWERQLAATGNTECHPKTCMAAPTPATDGRRVFALFATGDLAALDRDGNLLWYRSLVGDYPDVTNQVGMAASPVLTGERLFVPMENAGDSFAACLDAATGKNRWKVARDRCINWVTPLVIQRAGATEVVFQTARDVTAYDARTGKERWTFTQYRRSEVSSPTPGEDGTVLVPGQPLTALRPPADGGTPSLVWKSLRLPTGYTSPVCYKGRVYALTGQGLRCAHGKTGKDLWLERIKGPFSASPVAADGKVYVVNEEGVVTVLRAGDETAILGTSSVGETLLATPAIAGGALYLRSDRHLYCIAADGKK
jgi:outer membrane protein assembly factor BamB